MNNNRHQLPQMAEYLYSNGVRRMVEIGCAEGISTKIWMNAGIIVYGVDPYISGYDNGDGQSRQSACETARKIFTETVVNNQSIFHIDKKSADAAISFEDHSLDFVYIDGCHKYDNVINDINVWLPKIKKNMFIGGDDFHRVDKNTGRTEVKDAFIEKLGIPDKIFEVGHVLYKVN